MLHHTRMWAAAAIIALIVIAGFALSVPHTGREAAETQSQAPAAPPAVSIQDSYKAGTRTIRGSIAALDACATATAEATLLGDASTTESILLDISMPPTSGVCLKVPTDVPFTTSIEAPEDAPLQVTVNGATASTTAS